MASQAGNRLCTATHLDPGVAFLKRLEDYPVLLALFLSIGQPELIERANDVVVMPCR